MTRNLSGRRCTRCELVTVPGEPFGCERCGARREEHVDAEFDSAGTVHGIAVVYRHAREEPPTPFTVVEVRLDAGPVVRTRLVGSQLESAGIGSRVVGTRIDGRVNMVLEGETTP